ncbi:LPS export ABC transporter permease LptG [Sodalis sp. CWE]|uniref:LPS export ABC transporter permease LptG n=1 Tax=Sodalis sp. CWE TaxID=2803816 RepID=UPI001C7D7B9C|nr:LPS export ABC transporter permease LptG [Sodalis sp. CWE]MBX4180774.1 LPS export ABC transporter permease LptG [Sodalis sp. CWE]
MFLSILDRYIGKTLLNTVIMSLFVLISLSSIIKFVEQLRKVGQGNYSTFCAGLFTLFSVPKDIEVFLPESILLGTLLGLGSLITNNELVVIQAAGISLIRITGSVMKTTFPLILLTVIISEWISPVSEKMAHNYRTNMIYNDSTLSAYNDLWIKDGDDFIFIKSIIGSNKLVGINIYHLMKKRLKSFLYAETATFSNNIWRLSQVSKSTLIDDKKISSQNTENDEWKTDITPEKLEIILTKPESMSVSELYNYVNYLDQNKQKSNRYLIYVWAKIFSPLSVAVMIFVAISFILGPLHNVSMGTRIITGISLGFLFFITEQILRTLSLIYNIPPILGVLFPSAIFITISIGVLLLRH